MGKSTGGAGRIGSKGGGTVDEWAGYEVPAGMRQIVTKSQLDQSRREAAQRKATREEKARQASLKPMRNKSASAKVKPVSQQQKSSPAYKLQEKNSLSELLSMRRKGGSKKKMAMLDRAIAMKGTSMARANKR